MVSRPPRGRYLAKSLQNRGKNEVRPGVCPLGFAAELRDAPRAEVRLAAADGRTALAYARARARGLATNGFIYKPRLTTV